MAIQEYILTFDEGEMTPELRALLESKGAAIREATLPTLNLSPEDEAQILKDLEAADRGDFSSFKTMDEVKAGVEALKSQFRKDG